MTSVSIIDWIGKLNDGVAVILSLMMNEKTYEIMYWFNRDNDYRLVISDNFYEDYPKIKNIYEYKNFRDLVLHIDQKVLPPREEIFSEFL